MSLFEELAQQTSLYTQEQLMPTQTSRNGLFIGLPKESSEHENRIMLTPEAVTILTRNGHRVVVENGAGLGATFSDNTYSEAGAMIVHSPQEVYENAQIILKINVLTHQEFEWVKPQSTIVSALMLPKRNVEYFKKMNEKQLTGISYEHIEDKSGGLPVVRAMSEIAGCTVMFIAAEYLSSANHGQGIIMGGITGVPPTKVVVLGAGTVAEYAVRTAIGLGADIKIFDKHIYRLQRLKYAVGQYIYTSIIDSETLADAIKRADVVIGAMRAEGTMSPCIVTEEMVSQMRPNSVLIDVSIDQGGCIETSEMTNLRNPTFKKYDVIHYCVPNIPSRVACSASTALSNVFTPYLLETGQIGGIEAMMFANKWFIKGVYCYNGSMTNLPIARQFNLRFKDLSLLLAARM
jgi:alanine dehydrogenase